MAKHEGLIPQALPGTDLWDQVTWGVTALTGDLAMRRVTFSALRQGMRMGDILGRPESSLRAHQESDDRLASVELLLGAS